MESFRIIWMDLHGRAVPRSRIAGPFFIGSGPVRSSLDRTKKKYGPVWSGMELCLGTPLDRFSVENYGDQWNLIQLQRPQGWSSPAGLGRDSGLVRPVRVEIPVQSGPVLDRIYQDQVRSSPAHLAEK